MRYIATLLLILTFSTSAYLSVAQQSRDQPTESTIQDSAAVEDSIIATLERMESAYAKGNLEEIAAVYRDDAAIIGNFTMVQGRDEINAYWNNLKGRNLKWSLENESIEVFDEIAIQQGISRFGFMHDGKERLAETRFTLIWQLTDGEWRIKRDHYTRIQNQK